MCIRDRNFALSLMLIVFVMTIYFPAGLILLTADLLLFPGLWLSFRQVAKYGKEKYEMCAENVSGIVEYVSGIQTFRGYGVGGLKNKTVIHAMQEFSRISFVYEAKEMCIRDSDSRVYLCSADDDGLQGSGRAFYRFCYPRDRESQSPDLSCQMCIRDRSMGKCCEK